jgi:hypothetical protein
LNIQVKPIPPEKREEMEDAARRVLERALEGFPRHGRFRIGGQPMRMMSNDLGYTWRALPEVWAWDDEDKIYRNDETGEVMDEYSMIALRDQIVDWQVDFFSKWPVEEDEKPKDDDDSNILALLFLGLITLGVWEARMRNAIQDAWVTQYLFGRGGEEQMKGFDWDSLEEQLLIQYGFLNGFSAAIYSGAMSEAMIANRAELYFSSAIAAFEMGRMKAYHERLALTRHPGDCTSECCARDKCYWHYVDTKAEVRVKWIRTAAESCDTCIFRSDCPEIIFVKATGEHINMKCYEDADAL